MLVVQNNLRTAQLLETQRLISLWNAWNGVLIRPQEAGDLNMKITHLFLSAGSFALGAVVGACVIYHSKSVKASVGDTQALTMWLAGDVGADIAYLYRLRDGRTDVVRSVLEMRADSDLVLLSERTAVLPTTERDSVLLKTIQLHREYREKYPYTNSVPSITEGVIKAYRLLGETSKEKK
jgi:hypothetical protein